MAMLWARSVTGAATSSSHGTKVERQGRRRVTSIRRACVPGGVTPNGASVSPYPVAFNTASLRIQWRRGLRPRSARKPSADHHQISLALALRLTSLMHGHQQG